MYMPADRISRLEEKTVNFSNADNEKQRKKNEICAHSTVHV